MWWLTYWRYMQAPGVQVPVTARIQNRTGVPRHFRSGLQWRSWPNKPQREGCLAVWKTKTKVASCKFYHNIATQPGGLYQWNFWISVHWCQDNVFWQLQPTTKSQKYKEGQTKLYIIICTLQRIYYCCLGHNLLTAECPTANTMLSKIRSADHLSITLITPYADKFWAVKLILFQILWKWDFLPGQYKLKMFNTNF